ncbi:MAG: FxsB family radical SAM/SPASM domain protein [Coleofasciculus sp. C3-bin4]|nr:FxsB family radical SAM/SPASM domain protein [Coleofasciculus sp. C3-bin4]
MPSAPRITCFLVKIASRCNLACDYCYMYRHADQSWRSRPSVMSEKHRQQLAARIAEYVQGEQLEEIAVVFHGGEPLLAGAERIVETARWIRSSVPTFCKVGFSLQTNGILLDEPNLNLFATEDIGVSLSIDGSKSANDRHRIDHQGRSSFIAVEAALNRLKAYPKIYTGLIAVIDSAVSPDELMEFFNIHQPPRLDFLLPDSNHLRLPPGRDEYPDLYVSWLIRAFDLWFDKYPHLPIRTFDAILSSLAGLPSQTDALGLGDVSLLTIETDGTYHDLDVLKITAEGATTLGLGLETASIATAAGSPRIAEHRKLLRRENLAVECQSCPVVEVCGGGSVPHRYSLHGFLHPTVYCREMFALITHARTRVMQQLNNELEELQLNLKTPQVAAVDIEAFECPQISSTSIQNLLPHWIAQARSEFKGALEAVLDRDPKKLDTIRQIHDAPSENLDSLVIRPSVVLWTTVMQQSALGITVRSIDGDSIAPDTNYVESLADWLKVPNELVPYVHRNDPWLRLPFGQRIVFESDEVAAVGTAIIKESLSVIESWRPTLLAEIKKLSHEIQFIQDLTAHPDKVVSFSDNSVPGTLYVSIRQGTGFIDPYNLADSIIHEHRHQKLYLLQRVVPLVEVDTPFVPSPWREDLRPPSGLLHAVFVFTHLLEFWNYLVSEGPSHLKTHASEQVAIIRDRLKTAIPTLKGTRLTLAGVELVERLESITANTGAVEV